MTRWSNKAVGLDTIHALPSRRHDAVTAWRLLSLPNGGDRVLVEPTALHGDVEDAVHDRAVVIHARR